jgi:vancomycin resistance protein YoaR
MSNIADELTKNKVDQLVDPGKVIAFKADDHEAYQKMSVLGLAHKFKARQVLYADVISFTVTAPLGSETAKGTLTARVKIIDAQTGQTRWPQDSGAQVITVESPTLPLKSDGSLEPLNDYIVDRLSSQIAMLFYDHPKVEKGEAEQVDNF